MADRTGQNIEIGKLCDCCPSCGGFQLERRWGRCLFL